MKNDKPFDSNKSISIGDLTIENSEDKVIIYGDLDITRDKAGLNKLNQLLSILNNTKNQLEKEDLPDSIEIKASVVIKNPFKS